MHGLGNDFVVIDMITQSIKLRTAHIKRLCDRHLGIGCDQLLLLEPPIQKGADFYFRIFNATGEEVEQCGNGARCAARFFYDMGFTNNNSLKADCLAGQMTCAIEQNGEVTIKMGIPIFKPSEIPFIAEKEALQYPFQHENEEILISALSMGNPHAVIEVGDIQSAPVEKLGAWLNQHPRFPNQINVGFMQVIDKNHIDLRVFERGVGETLACGSGAAAAVVAGIRLNLLESPAFVRFSKGELKIAWSGEGQAVTLTGPTTSVYAGRFRL